MCSHALTRLVHGGVYLHLVHGYVYLHLVHGL